MAGAPQPDFGSHGDKVLLECGCWEVDERTLRKKIVMDGSVDTASPLRSLV